MAVVKMCDRCGKYYDLCDDCVEKFYKFIKGDLN